MTTATTSSNGSVRKNLASQLDRLDHILDGLAEGLQEAVAQAVQQAVTLAVQEAVRGILTELLTNPELLGKLRANLGITSEGTAAVQNDPVEKQSHVARVTRKVSTWFSLGWHSLRRT